MSHICWVESQNHRITLHPLYIRRSAQLLDYSDPWGKMLSWYKPVSTSRCVSDHADTCHPVWSVIHQKAAGRLHGVTESCWQDLQVEMWQLCQVGTRSSQSEFCPAANKNKSWDLYIAVISRGFLESFVCVSAMFRCSSKRPGALAEGFLSCHHSLRYRFCYRRRSSAAGAE